MNLTSYYSESNPELKEFSQKNLMPSRALRLILKKTKISSLFERYVSDPRRQASTFYSLPSLLMQNLLNLILQRPSKHSFADGVKLSPYLGQNVAALIRANHTSSSKTSEDSMIKLDPSEFEAILPHLFSSLVRSKFFILHPEFKAQEEGLLLSLDAEISHTYYESSQHPCESCPFCLKRTRGDKVWYLHCDVILSVVGKNGFHFPLFLYRVKNKQNWVEKSEDEFKQECELSALPHLLEKFRQFFPHMDATLGLDSLYAQQTAMNLCEIYRLFFIIVRKQGSLRSLTEEAEGLKKIVKPHFRKFSKKRFLVEQEAYLLSNLSYREHTFTLIDLKETMTKKPTKRFAKIHEKKSHWQWIVKEAIKANELWSFVQKGRLRWNQEDFFNSIKNRGFHLKHDFSRHPNSQTIWRYLILIAFALSTLMRLSAIGAYSRKGCSFINWISFLFAELSCCQINILEPLPQQLRFWNDSS